MNEPVQRKQYILCLICRGRFSDDDLLEHPQSCPSCENRGVPGDLNKIATATLTHQEWRVLAMWAANWASHIHASDKTGHHSPATISAICRELKRQDPNMPPLSLYDEVQELSDTLQAKCSIADETGQIDITPQTRH